jgi:hypothetical protein
MVDSHMRQGAGGIDAAVASAGSCTTVIPPRSLIAGKPAAPSSSCHVRTTPTMRARIDGIEREAAQVCDWPHTLTGLVDPEPTQD